MAHEQLSLSIDEVLSTTRAVRKRLDLEKPVSDSVLKECVELAIQAPSGSNAQGWQFVFVTDPEIKEKIGEFYRQAAEIYATLPFSISKQHQDSDDTVLKESQARSSASGDYLAENIGKAPALLIPCIKGRTDTPETNNLIAQASLMASIIPATWNFMLAARARGLGTSWTTIHLMFEKQVGELIGIPGDEFMQVALIPIGYTKGTDFKPAYRKPVETVVHFNKW